MTEIREEEKVIVKYPDYSPMEATVVDTSPISHDYGVEYDKDYPEVRKGQPDTVIEKFVSRYPPECTYHRTQKLYHDKREEWLCPWCEL